MEFAIELSDLGYLGLFIAAFIAGSVVPFSSEVVLGVLLVAGFDPWTCVWVATAGNWLGGIFNFYLGYLGKIEWIHKYLHISQEKIDKMQAFLQGKGSLFAFFAFLPLIGHSLVVLGLMRANRLGVFSSMLLGKFLRYFVLIIGYDLIKTYFVF